MPGARRAPPPPPSGTTDSPPPLPSRNGPGTRTRIVTDSAPPPLPSRPGAAAETSDDMYEDMNGGFPKIIDARPKKKIVSEAILPGHISSSDSMDASVNRCPSPQFAPKTKPKSAIRMWDSFREIGHNIAGRGHKDADSTGLLPPPSEKKRRSTVGEMGRPKELQQQNLMMDETYEMPVPNIQADQHVFPTRQLQRNDKPDDDDDQSEGWSESEFDEVDEEQPTGDETYEMPELETELQDDLYQDADPVDTFSKPRPSPPAKKSAASVGPMSLHPATLQMGKMKLNNISSQESSSSSAQKKAATNDKKPTPPPKPANDQRMSGSSIVKALAQKLNERTKGFISGFDKPEVKEIQSDDNSSAGSSSSQSGAQPQTVAKEIRPAVPIHPPKLKESTVPPKKPARQLTVDEDDESGLIYDEAVTETLTLYDWYHGQVDRNVAKELVKTIGQDGTFLIRESSQSSSGHRYTLVVMCNGKVHNLIIRQRSDNNFALGQNEKPDEVHFPSLKDLVEHHRVNNVRLLKEEELVKLSSSPKRS